MTDPATGSELVTVSTATGGERHLQKASPADRVRLANAFRAHRRRLLSDNADAAGVTPDDRMRRLEELDRKPVRRWDLYEWFHELEGQYAGITLCLRKDRTAQPTPAVAGETQAETDRQADERDFDALGLPEAAWLGLVMRLWDLQFVDEGGGAKGTVGPLAGTPPAPGPAAPAPAGTPLSPTISPTPTASGSTST